MRAASSNRTTPAPSADRRVPASSATCAKSAPESSSREMPSAIRRRAARSPSAARAASMSVSTTAPPSSAARITRENQRTAPSGMRTRTSTAGAGPVGTRSRSAGWTISRQSVPAPGPMAFQRALASRTSIPPSITATAAGTPSMTARSTEAELEMVTSAAARATTRWSHGRPPA